MSADDVVFNRDIRPILSENCFHCHGPDASSREADLRLDERQSAVKLEAIVPGKPAQSELIARVFSLDPDEKMPPPHSKKRLSEKDKSLLKQWIASGAEYQSHWSFLPIENVTVPDVQNKGWTRNAIDNFILQKLERNKFKPATRASRERLIRRLSFDLNGLPPTIEEIDAFLADESDNAYEKLVDRLLASPHYGERMAADWLDVARYSDTYGYQVDRDRYVWPWRDWVIRAFNRNLSYDQFITEQIAGDLLPNASDEQILATTFNRLHPQKVEGGSTPEEFRVEYVADRTQTFATAFLGLTLECARCHDHKYDPITQKEYYQLSAFFDNIDEAGLYSFFTRSVPTPTLRLTDAKTNQQIENLKYKKLAVTENEFMSIVDEIVEEKEYEAWLAELRKKQKTENEDYTQLKGQIAHLDFEKGNFGRNQQVAGYKGKAVKLTGDDAVKLKIGNFNRSQPFTVTLWMNTPDDKQRAVIFHRSRAWTDAGSRGYQLLIEEGKLSASLIHFWPGNAIRVKTKQKIPTNKWLHVAVRYEGSSRAFGLRIYINGKMADCEVVRDNLTKNITGGGGDNISIGERFRDRGFTNGMVDEFRVYDRALSRLEIIHLIDGNSLNETLQKAKENKLSITEKNMLAEYYGRNINARSLQIAETLQKQRKELNQLLDKQQEIMVMREMKLPRQTYLLKRGNYDARSEKVFPITPAVFPAMPAEAKDNRLGLANWLTNSQNPLTARVAVNRFWQMLFGSGLVRTPEDFGSQGQPPTHPELLDWLAHDFIKHNWDIKRLLKLMVMSATYQQDSIVAEQTVKRDPENRLYSRYPSHRLPAEMLRDNVLAASDLLVDRIGGPPARPYELEVSFKPVKRQSGEGLYRRSIYTYWKRTGPAPVMMSLDASKRDVCRVKRERTSSPLQTLVLFNGPQFVEAARMLSQKLIQQYGDNHDAIFTDMFRILTSRFPDPQEKNVLVNLFIAQQLVFKQDKKRTAELLKIGDSKPDTKIDPVQLAATTIVASMLYNFEAALMKN